MLLMKQDTKRVPVVFLMALFKVPSSETQLLFFSYFLSDVFSAIQRTSVSVCVFVCVCVCVCTYASLLFVSSLIQ